MFEGISNLVKNNPLVSGGLGLGAVTWAYGKVKGLATCELTIYSEDRIYSAINRWLSQHPSTKKMRKLGVARWYDNTSETDEFALSPGTGTHMLWYRGKPMLVDRHIVDDDKQSDGYQRRQSITITTFGRSQELVRQLLEEVRHIEDRRGVISVHIYVGGGEYMLIDRRAKRSMDTIYCAPGLKEDILTDVEKFFSARADYAHRGIPYRRGYLLEGPPGTGKTTLIYAIASAMEKPVYLLNPASLDNDNQLHHAVNGARDGILVMEDIDSLRASENRETAERPEFTGEASKSGVTLSGLLNALDGLGTRDGNVLFLTSNTPEVLDPALLRPGRIDRRFRLEKAAEGEARAMFARLNPTGDVEKFIAGLNLPCAQAEIQNMILAEQAAEPHHGASDGNRVYGEDDTAGLAQAAKSNRHATDHTVKIGGRVGVQRCSPPR